MSRHLKPAEIADALDGALALKRQAHVDQCATCRRAIDDLGRVRDDVAASADLPEPSPLFWTHFSDRVREAVRDEAPAPRRWFPLWQPITAVGVIVVAALALLALPDRAGHVEDVTAPAAEVAQADELVPGLDEESWAMVVGFASELEPEEVAEVARPKAGTTDAMIDSLTVEQRREFVRLLRAEMGNLE